MIFMLLFENVSFICPPSKVDLSITIAFFLRKGKVCTTIIGNKQFRVGSSFYNLFNPKKKTTMGTTR